MDRDASLAFLRSGRMHFSRYESTDLEVHSVGEAAIVFGRMERVRRVGGEERADDWRFVKVYVHDAGVWRVALFSATPTH
jgi:hypothetical protein